MLGRIRRFCARSATGTVPAGMIGSRGTCAALVAKGYVVLELESIGRQGGRYYRYRVVRDPPARPVDDP